MADQLQLRGGSSTEQASFTGASREVTVDTTLNTLRVHDGSTAGGTILAKASDVTSNSNTLATALGIAAGAANFGAFTGSTIGDNQSLKQILQVVETLIENIAQMILKDFNVEYITLSISKPGAIRDSKDVGITITRSN